MKAPEADPGARRPRSGWSASVLVLGLLLAWPAVGQSTPAPPTPPPVPSAKPADEDPLGRSTPFGAVAGYIRAVKNGDYARAAQYLDTRKGEAAAEDLARQLQVVLDRGLQADIDRLSREPGGNLEDGLPDRREKVGTVELRSGKVEVLLERVDREGQTPVWLFSSQTLALVPEAAEELSAFDPEELLPAPLVKITIGSLPLYRWIGILLGLALALALGALVTRALVPLLRPLLRRMTGEEDDRTLVSIKTPIRLILISVVIQLLSSLAITIGMRQFWTRVGIVVGILGLAWLVLRFNTVLAELGTRGLRHRGKVGKIALWNLLHRLFKAAVVVATALVLLHRAGADLTAVLTGLGIGGIGLALAAQKTLENLFGGVMIITDEPVRVGDFCRVGDQMGTVEDIGLRSTRIRTLSRTVIAVPNGQLASMDIENFSARDKFWFRHAVGVRYETSADQLRYLLVEIRAMLYSHPKVERDGARIRFVGFGGSSLDLEIFAYVRATEMPEFLGIQEDLLLRIMDLIEKAGTGIAFPSQTTYLAKDTPLDPRRAEEAVTRVRRWREGGDLPFPDFRPDQEGQVSGPIEYPPPGSSLRSGPGGPGGT